MCGLFNALCAAALGLVVVLLLRTICKHFCRIGVSGWERSSTID